MCRNQGYLSAGAHPRVDYSPQANPYAELASEEDQALLGHLLVVAGKVADQLGVADAFRLVINNGAGGGQTVFHLHLHILAGRDMKEGELASGLA